MTIDSAQWYARQWTFWRDAIEFPPLVGEQDFTITFTLGRTNFGYEYGKYKRYYKGTALDLTGASVQLRLRKMGRGPSLIEAARGEDWTASSTLCTIDGTITDAENGVVTFAFTDEDSDGLGDYMAEIRVEDASGNYIVPGRLRFTFHENFF